MLSSATFARFRNDRRISVSGKIPIRLAFGARNAVATLHYEVKPRSKDHTGRGWRKLTPRALSVRRACPVMRVCPTVALALC